MRSVIGAKQCACMYIDLMNVESVTCVIDHHHLNFQRSKLSFVVTILNDLKRFQKIEKLLHVSSAMNAQIISSRCQFWMCFCHHIYLLSQQIC